LATHDVVLTPAQISFLGVHISGFSPEGWEVESAGCAGSDRRFVRVRRQTPPHLAFVLVVWNSGDADWARFIAVEREVRPQVDFLPVLYAYDEKHGMILEEDLGARTLHAHVRAPEIATEEISDAYSRVVNALTEWQAMDPAASPAIAARAMDEEMFLWESDYFARHCVTEFFGREDLLDEKWDRERREIARRAAALPRVCIHRDFQSENILLQDRRVRFVDFQGARLGPAGYDLASLLYDPYVNCLDAARIEDLLQHYRATSPHELSDEAFRTCAVQRLMQALGAYGNLSIHKGKEWYRAYVPIALKRLTGVVAGREEFRALGMIAGECANE
jgi:aminoglycoside/choline kinase family phosphotransferase